MKTILTLLFVLFAVPAFAADGDPCSTGNTYAGGACWLLCDAETADVACAEFRLPGFYRALALELQYASCTAGTVVVTQTSVSGDATPDTITTMTVGGTETVHIQGDSAHPMRFLTATTSGMSACTLDVRVHAVQ